MPVTRITKETLKERIENDDPAAKPVLIDARLKYPYEHSTVRLPGAVRLSTKDPEMATLPRNREIVAYDSDPEELVGVSVAAALIRQGFRVSVLKGGITDWMTANFPVEKKEAPKQSLPAPGSLKS